MAQGVIVEVHKHVDPVLEIPFDLLRLLGQLPRGIAGGEQLRAPVEPQVGELGREHIAARIAGRIRNTEGRVVATKQAVDFFGEPGLVAELEDQPHPRRVRDLEERFFRYVAGRRATRTKLAGFFNSLLWRTHRRGGIPTVVRTGNRLVSGLLPVLLLFFCG
jgi:hypothetical protein